MQRRGREWIALCAVLLVVVTLTLWSAGVANAAARTYTTDADFDEGVLTGLEHETVPDQLQFTVEPKMMPFIWIPNDGQGTISKVNTDTGDEVGRYRVSPHTDSMPSRTTIDLRGACWVGVRQAGTVVKIGLHEAGDWIDRNADGICQTSYDANADGDITGDELLPWGEDECVLFEVVLVAGYEGPYVPGTYTGPYDYEYSGTAPRSLAIDADNNLWAGTNGTSKFHYVDGATGAVLKTIDVSPWGHNPYGAVTDRNGCIWSSSSSDHVLKLDPRTNPPTITRLDCLPPGAAVIYGLAVDHLGHLFLSVGGDPGSIVKIDVDTDTVEWSKSQVAMVCCSQGLVCSNDNDVWVANRDGPAVHRFDNDGNFKVSIPANAPCGVAVDTAGKVWIGDYGDEFIHRVDPETNEIELSKQIIGGGGHYTYSDMTGVVSWSITAKQGVWSVIYDSGAAASPWGTISWNGEEPAGSTIAVEVRSSENALDWSAWEMALNNTPLVITPTGRYLEMRVALATVYGAEAPVLYDLTVESHAMPLRRVCHTGLETARSPWSAFATGAGEANTWRRALTSDPLAHSGTYALSSEVNGDGSTGVTLELPPDAADVTFRAWAYVADRTVGDASTFLGLSFANDVSDWTEAVGWQVQSDSLSQFRLLSTWEPTSVGLATGDWHLVQMQYTRATGALKLWVDADLIKDVTLGAGVGRSPTFAVLCASGTGGAAVQHVYFDDLSVSLTGYPSPSASRAFALVELQEQVVQTDTVPYTLQYGNGYPVLGLEEITGTLPGTIYVGLSLPAGYSLVTPISPSPGYIGADGPVWGLSLPELGQAGLIQLQAVVPTGAAETATDRMWAWATTDSGASSADPPSPPGITTPPDGVWGVPQDLLPQEIAAGPRPDLWVRKVGPRFAAPGDTLEYAITVGNSGDAAATGVVVRDLMPALLGNGDSIIANIASLDPGETWTGALSGTLPWGIPGGTLVLNTAYTPTAALETVGANNSMTYTSTIQAAHDPNEIINSPFAGVDRGQLLTYTLCCENTGAGNAYGVYATCELASGLDASTLRVSNPALMRYDAVSRTLIWEVGQLAGGKGATTWFTIEVADDARRARPIIEQAAIYFPSVPEETPTNIVANVVKGSFPDVAWDHWGVLDIERIFEAGLAAGYPNGTYQPQVAVSRAQMAIYIARALTGGDAYIPTGPATPTFADVTQDPGDPYSVCYQHIEYAVANAIVFGYPDGLYHPEVPVDRGQMAIFVSRAVAGGDLNVPAGPPTPTFPDVTQDAADPYSVCYDHIEYAVSYAVVAGYPDGNYHPDYVVTRGLMAIYLARAFRLPM